MKIELYRERRQKRRLRIFLGIMARRGSDAARTALHDRSMFDDVFDRMRHERTDEDRPVLDLLDWLVENADAIMAIIEKLIALFGASTDEAGEV